MAFDLPTNDKDAIIINVMLLLFVRPRQDCRTHKRQTSATFEFIPIVLKIYDLCPAFTHPQHTTWQGFLTNFQLEFIEFTNSDFHFLITLDLLHLSC